MNREQLIEGIWERDSTVWTGGDEAHWLGWLDEPLHVQEQLDDFRRLAESLHNEVDHVVLCGMGGSSLAPEVLRRSFGVDWFHVLDTTHPKAIRALEEKLDLERTFFVSSSKSGTTLETRSHTDYFWQQNGKRGAMFAAVTDPGSELERLARRPRLPRRLRRRAVDRRPLLGPLAVRDRARGADGRRCSAHPRAGAGDARGVPFRRGQPRLRARQPRSARAGATAATRSASATRPATSVLWAEQLIAESTGKHGKGLVPAPGESPDGADRQGAQPELPDPYALGAEFFRWEFAIAVAGAYLEINPFDQPDVQAAKDKTNEVLATGKEPELEPEGSIEELLAQKQEGDYACVQAFIEPTAENDRRIADLVARLRRESGLVVTHGYGPRYQHSTGQLHKGGPNTGLFLQVIDDEGDELPIPGKPFGFRRLIRAQAAGDLETLKERGRRVARVRLEDI